MRALRSTTSTVGSSARAAWPRRGVVRANASLVQDAQRATLGAPGDASPIRIAPIIVGCWQLAGGHGNAVFDGVEQKLQAHADAGFTTFDSADIYGPSEQILGAFAEQRRGGGGQQQQVQLLTKFVPNIFQQRVTPSSAEAAARKSMAALRVDSLDLVQLHWWDYSIPGMVDAALALADLKAKGLIKQVGVTNMDTEALAKIVDAGVPVVSNQVQFSLLDRRPLNGGMSKYCRAQNIKLLTYGSVGGGLLSDRYVEAPRKGLFGGAKFSNVDLNTSSLKMYFGVVRQFGGQELWRRLLVALKGVADKHGVSVANVALRWVMDAEGGGLVHPIVGMRGVDHIDDNARALSLKLDDADRAAIDEVLADAAGPAGDIYSFERSR